MKKQIFSLTLFSIMLYFPSSSQVIFQKTIGGFGGDQGLAAQITTDGGYIIAGRTSGVGEIFLVKTNSIGDTLWVRSFGGFDVDVANSVQQTNDGGYILAGTTFTFGAGDADIYVVKTDSGGNLIWSKAFGGIYDDEGTNIQQTADSGYIVTGSNKPCGVLGCYPDVYLLKLNTNGNLMWAKKFGNTADDKGNYVRQTADGGYIIAGYNTTGQFSDIYLIKTDANGDSLWTKSYGGNSSESARCIQLTSNGDFIIAGSTNSFGAGSGDVLLMKTDSNGNILWSKTYGGTSNEFPRDLQLTADGGYILTGNTGSFGVGNDIYLIKTDSIGDIVWTKNFGANAWDEGYAVHQTSDGGFIVAGSSPNLNPGIGIYLIKTDANGISGCHEGNPVSITGSPGLLEHNFIGSISTGATETTASTVLESRNTLITTSCTSVGINEISLNNSFLVSPSPSKGNFTISFKKRILQGKIEIINILGKETFTKNISNESRKEIHLNNISSGIYFVKVFDGEKSYCKKLIIE